MKYRIWSFQHKLWWRAKSNGYCSDFDCAGIYEQEDAIRICINANHHSDVEEAMVPVEKD